MTRSVKVLHVLDHSLPITDGYSMRSHNILRYQQRSGLVPVGLTSGKHGQSLSERDVVEEITYYRSRWGSRTRRFNTTPVISEVLLMRDLHVRILQLAQQEKIELIHVHSPVLNGIPALLAGRQLSLPVVYELRALWEEGRIPFGQYHVTGLKAAITRKLETWLMKRVQAVTTICEGLKEEIVLRGIPAERVQVFLNGVDTVRYRPQPINQALKRSLNLDGAFVLGFIGSFYEWEGLDLLVKSLQGLRILLPNARLLLVGGGEAESWLRSLSKTLGVEGHVVFTGRVPNTAILDYYSIIDLCVYPRPKTRLTDRVTPLKPLEAMAMEKLVLASDVGGHRELIEDGVDGFLFKAGDHEDLTSRVAELEKGISQFGHVGQKARQRVERSRNWETITSAYNLLYKRVFSFPSG